MFFIKKNAAISIFKIIILFVFLFPSYLMASNTSEMLEDALKKIDDELQYVPENIKRVAVYNIEIGKNKEINVDSLKDQITTILMNSGKFQVIDREMLDQLIKEQELSLTGMVKTTEMIKVGKLVGVQGFFYGSVDVHQDKLILNLKLIDVTSSAIVFSKKIFGEAVSSFTRIGIGWGYVTTTYGTTFEITRNSQAVVEHTHEMPDLSCGTLVNLLFTYKQAFKGFKYTQLGIDVGFTKFFEPAEGEYDTQQDISDSYTDWTYYTTHTLSYFQVNLRPRIYLSSKYIIGWNHDWINPYLGAAFNWTLFNSTFSGWKENRSGGSNVEYEETSTIADPYVVIVPLLGFEVNFTKSLTIFLECGYLPSDAKASEVQSAYVAEMEMQSKPYVQKGLSWSAGVKYYFTIF